MQKLQIRSTGWDFNMFRNTSASAGMCFNLWIEWIKNWQIFIWIQNNHADLYEKYKDEVRQNKLHFIKPIRIDTNSKKILFDNYYHTDKIDGNIVTTAQCKICKFFLDDSVLTYPNARNHLEVSNNFVNRILKNTTKNRIEYKNWWVSF